MKKFTLFLFAIFAMVNVANAQRAWAYDLELTPSVDSYTFAFKAVTAGDATLVFYKEGVEAGTLNLGSVSAGDNIVTKTSEELLSAIGKAGDFTWGVKMTGGAIAEMKELTKDSETDFHFWMPTGVAVDNNPESPYFSQFYIASPRSGKMTEGGGSGIQHNAGVYVFDQTLKLLNETKQQGYLPSNVKSYVSGSNHMELHRIAVNPITHKVAFTHQSTSVTAAVWNMDPADMKATATNLIDGTVITKSNSLCFDENGVLYVVNSTDKKVYTVKDGVVNTFGTSAEFIQDRNAIVTDGRGGLWIAQYRAQDIAQDGYARLMHFNDEGTLDYKVDKDTPHDFTGTAQRGAVAYNTKEDVLAFGANRYGNLYKVTYNAETGVPSLESIGKTPSIAANIDGLAFDYAGDLYVTSASVERLFKYEVPTTNNTCTTPAKKSQVITLVSATPEHTVTINVNGNGTVTGANTGKYLEGTELTLTPKPNTGYEFTGWTFEDETTSTDNPLIITVDGDKNITANFAKKQYTLTVQANDPTKGSVALDPAGGIYEYETEVTLTATANDAYEFVNWSNGSKENPLTITMEENTELTANFRAILPTSITLYAHPTKDYSTSIVGTMKRAIQNGENTIVLTHEDNGTPHIYNIAHATKEVTEISQEGVVAVDPDNAGDFLAISDIALTDDGKLVACNYMMCQITANEVDAGYKRGTSRFYIWDNLGGDPRLWISSQLTGNYYRASMGYTMALKGTSMNAEVTISAFNKTNTNTRYSHLYVVDGAYSDANYKYSRDNAALHPSTLGPNTYELNASPLAAGQWILDGELTSPIEFVEKDAIAIDTYTALNTNVLGKKYNGASYLFHNDHHLMIAPYATDDKLAGVKVLGITDGFGSPVQVETNSALVNAIDATTAAATAYVDGDGDLTIYLIADGKVYTFSEKVYTAQTFTVTANAGEGGTVEGGGPYEENTTATLTATPAEHYDFVNWTEGEEVVSTTAEYSFTVLKDIELTANFQEHAKYTITASAADNTMGSVIGGGTYYKDTEVTLTATANSGYVFVNWNDDNTDATRTFTAGVDMPETLTANFKVAVPRAWAYDLKVAEDGGNYKFTFIATSAGTATLLFADKEGNALAPTSYDLGAINAGLNTATVAKSLFTEPKDIYWSVKMDGEAITRMAELTNDNNTDYHFWMPTGVAVDNNPESSYFGQFYIASPRSGKMTEGGGNGIQHNAGVYVFDQTLTLLNETKQQGYIPSNVSVSGSDYLQLHRIAVNPINSEVAFSQKTASIAAIWNMNPANMKAAAVNLISETSIADANSLCFDKNGVLYVADASTNSIYKVKEGVATTFATTSELVQNRNAIASDGRGGLWIAQYRGQDIAEDAAARLMHINTEGTLDYKVDKDTPHGFTGTAQRGAVAYNSKENILAFGANRVATLYQVTYDLETGVPTLEELCKTPDIASNIDGLAFDYAGDLYVTSASVERLFKFVLPTNENSYTIPAPTSQVLKKETRYTVTVNVVGDGEVEGAGEYVDGTEAKLKAIADSNNEFVNWTENGVEVSTDSEYTFTVTEDVELVANFKKKSYTLTVFVNDEDKGTIDVATSSYEYGTEVTLNANPQPGYKLLGWSNKETGLQTKVIINNNKAISAYFVKEYDADPTYTITQVWKNSDVPASTSNGFQAVGWGGKIYLKDRLNRTIWEYADENSPIVYTQTDEFTSADETLKGDQPIAVDNAGNLIVRSGSGEFHTVPVQVTIYKQGTTIPKVINFDLGLPVEMRCDFITASGNIYSEQGGYVYFFCKDQTTVSRLFIKNGEYAGVDAVATIPNKASSQSNVVLDIYGNIHTQSKNAGSYEYNITTLVATEDSYLGAKTKKNPNSTIGGCTFELGGKELWAYTAGTTNYSSEWELMNVTDGVLVSDGVLCINDPTTVNKNNAANWLNVQVVDDNTAYIYQFCPTVGAAVWKVSIEAPKYTRTVTPGNYGTICLPYASSSYSGAEFYEVSWLQKNGETPVNLYLDQLESGTQLVAGKPYIFRATSTELTVTYTGAAVENPIAGENGLTGSFDAIPAGGVLTGNYVVAQTKFWTATATAYAAENRAYIDKGVVPDSEQKQIPGRRRVVLGTSGENAESGFEDIIAPEGKVIKVIENGQLIIIRDGEKYNVQGVRL